MWVSGDAAVESREDFQQVEEHVHAHRIGDDGGQGLHGFAAGLEAGHAAHGHQEQQQDGRTGAERGGEEAGGHDGGEPVVAARDAGVQETGDGVDGEGPDDGDVDEDLDPLRRLHVVAGGFKGDPADDDVQEEITEQNGHIPEHHGVRRGMQQHVESALRLPEVDHDEEHAHDHGTHGHEFAEDDDPFELLVMVEVGGEHEHHSACGHADEVGELGDVQPPGDVAAHAGDGKADVRLEDVHDEAEAKDCAKEAKPQVEARPAFENQFEHGGLLDDVVHAGLGAQSGFAADGEVLRQGLTHGRTRIVQVAEDHRAFGGFHAGGELALSQAFGAERALLDHAAGTHGELGVHILHVGLRIAEVEAAGAERAAGHAETAADAAVGVHHHDAVLTLEGGGGGAHAYAGRVFAVVAQQEEIAVQELFGHVGVHVVREDVGVLVRPDPFDVLVAGDGGHVVGMVARVDHALEMFRRGELAGVDDHGPAFGVQGIRFVGVAALGGRGARREGAGLAPGCEGQGGSRAQRKGGETGYLQKVSSAFH